MSHRHLFLALLVVLTGCATGTKSEVDADALGWWCIGACAGASHERESKTSRQEENVPEHRR